MIQNNEKFCTVDTTAGRLHTNISNLPKELRPFIICYNGRRLVANIDIKNSQPYFSTLIFTAPQKIAQFARGENLRMILKSLQVQDSEDIKQYINLVCEGGFYEYLVVCNGPSKTFNLPGLQISNAIIPDQGLRQKLHTALRNLDQLFGVNTFGAIALQAAYEGGEDWLRQVMTYIEGNYLFLKDTLDRTVPEIKVVRPEAMYLIWLDCRSLGLAPDQLDRMFYQEARLYLENGQKYGQEGAGFMRINIACPRPILVEALSRITSVFEK